MMFLVNTNDMHPGMISGHITTDNLRYKAGGYRFGI